MGVACYGVVCKPCFVVVHFYGVLWCDTNMMCCGVSLLWYIVVCPYCGVLWRVTLWWVVMCHCYGVCSVLWYVMLFRGKL